VTRDSPRRVPPRWRLPPCSLLLNGRNGHSLYFWWASLGLTISGF
jgi:hypothetical protein